VDVLAGALIGSRIAYALVNWGYFSMHFVEIPQIWLGGLAWPGAVAGGLIALAVFALWTETGFAALADQLLPLVLVLTLSAWLADWQTGVAYGHISTAWWAAPSRDEWGETARRFPVQPIAAALTLFSFGLVDQLSSRLRRRGQIASLAFTSLTAILLLTSFLRADPAPIWQSFRLDTWAGLVCLGLALSFCTAAFWPGARKLPRLDSNRPSSPTNP
jgi:prolipoprotein diacylglyceryltransferase